MDKEYVVLEGKIFTVELLSNFGSTNYGWCISSLPEGIIMMGAENIHIGGSRSVTKLQRFYFGVVSSKELQVDINFTMNNWSDLTKVAEYFTAKVRIVPSNSSDFVSYSENVANTAIPYGLVYANENVANTAIPYGLVYTSDNMQDINVKYGYPCGMQDANLKYGYPCGVQEANLKYGYPCGVQDANLKYGYPCGVQDANLKYGYPCSMQDTNVKYGYACGVQDANLKYGYPCSMQDTNVKYGYACGVQDANLKYGYPCLEYTKDARPYGYPY
ncbi:MAG: hypothetical protein HFJ09_00565 [Lachnospiraceae bacterium]|nr:hypothetical protein [Lachnospiraceae bacterium]